MQTPISEHHLAASFERRVSSSLVLPFTCSDQLSCTDLRALTFVFPDFAEACSANRYHRTPCSVSIDCQTQYVSSILFPRPLPNLCCAKMEAPNRSRSRRRRRTYPHLARRATYRQRQWYMVPRTPHNHRPSHLRRRLRQTLAARRHAHALPNALHRILLPARQRRLAARPPQRVSDH